jgi:site-specific recombinase XerD
MKLKIRQQSQKNYLYADLNISGIRVKSTLGISVHSGRFNPKSEQVSNTPDDIELNQLIGAFRIEIQRAVRTLQNGHDLSALRIKQEIERIKCELTDPNNIEEQEIFLIQFGEKHIRRSLTTKKPSTIVQYQNCLNHLREYEKQQNKRITFESVDLNFYDSLLRYCYSSLNFSANSVGKLIKNIKLLMGLATEEGLHNNMFFKSRRFQKPQETADTIYLNISELQTIANTILPDYLENVRDLFLLGCFTGLRFSDYNKITKESFMENNSMLKVRTEKTGETVIIPLHPESRRIIEKHEKLGGLRIISNQKFNQFIKEVCRIAGLNHVENLSRTIGGKKITISKQKFELVSSHTARRSFATNAYLAGIQSLAIMSITGHKSELCFLKYIKVTKEEHAKVIAQHQFFQDNVA